MGICIFFIRNSFNASKLYYIHYWNLSKQWNVEREDVKSEWINAYLFPNLNGHYYYENSELAERNT